MDRIRLLRMGGRARCKVCCRGKSPSAVPGFTAAVGNTGGDDPSLTTPICNSCLHHLIPYPTHLSLSPSLSSSFSLVAAVVVTRSRQLREVRLVHCVPFTPLRRLVYELTLTETIHSPLLPLSPSIAHKVLVLFATTHSGTEKVFILLLTGLITAALVSPSQTRSLYTLLSRPMVLIQIPPFTPPPPHRSPLLHATHPELPARPIRARSRSLVLGGSHRLSLTTNPVSRRVRKLSARLGLLLEVSSFLF